MSAPVQATSVYVTLSSKSANNDLVQGCPGVPETLPRVEGIVKLRDRQLLPIHLKLVTIKLLRNEMVVTGKHTTTKRVFRDFEVCDVVAYSPPAGLTCEKLLSIDIPFTLMLPVYLPSSGRFAHGSAETAYYLEVCAIYGTTTTTIRQQFPVMIRKFDILPIYEIYTVPQKEIRQSSDLLSVMDVSIPRKAFGPGDDIMVNLQVHLNHEGFRKKKGFRFGPAGMKDVTLKSISLELIEIATLNAKADARSEKSTVICSHFEPVDEILDLNGFQWSLTMPVKLDRKTKAAASHGSPSIRFLKAEPSAIATAITSASSSTSTSSTTETATLHALTPFTHISGFTTKADLYTVEYKLQITAHMSSKNIEICLPLIISPYNIVDSHKAFKQIKKCIQEVQNPGWGGVSSGLLPHKIIRVYQNNEKDLASLQLTETGNSNTRTFVHYVL